MQVQPGCGGRALGVAVGDGASDGGVLGGAGDEPRVVVASEAAHAREVQAGALNRRSEVAAIGQAVVEGGVELGDERVVAVPLRVIRGERRAIDGREAGGEGNEPRADVLAVGSSAAVSCGGGRTRGEACGLLVEGSSQLEQSGDVVELDLADNEGAWAAFACQPGGDEPREGLPHRSAANPEPGRLLDLGQRRTRGKFALDDRATQGVERAIGSTAHALNVYIGRLLC